MTKTKKYNQFLLKLLEDKTNIKIIFKAIQVIRKDFGFTKYSFR